MADKKEEVPEHISKFKKLTKKAKQMIATTDKHHRNAYDTAVEEILMPEGSVDYDILKKVENREKFADVMSDFYITKAKQQFKVGKDAKFDDLEKELLMKAYSGTSRTELRQYAKKLGKDFTFEQFDKGIKPDLMEKLSKDLSAATTSHFKDEHIGDIVKYTKADKFLDTGKMRINEAIGVLGDFQEKGVVAEKKYKDKIFYKKPENK